MDAPADNVTEVQVQIKALWLKPQGQGPAIELKLASPTVTVDLLDHATETTAAVLLDSVSIPAGAYEWLEMEVNAEFDNVYDSFVMTTAGGQEELRVPSRRVRLVSGFDVGQNEAVKLIFDWSVRQGLVDPPGAPGYLLKPAFRMIDVTEYGSLSGTVAAATITGDTDCAADDPDYDVGNVVYIFAGTGITPDDIDGAAPEPIATAELTPNANGDYAYRAILAPGSHTATFTCQAGNDDPATDDVLEFSAPVDVTITGAAIVQDF